MKSKNVEIIKQFEGFRSKAYKDLADKWTIGYGHTKTASDFARTGREISLSEGEELLRRDVEEVERYINRLKLKINQDQFDALVSFTYNLGIGNLSRSKLLRLVKQDPNDLHIYYQFCRFIKSGGKKHRGLLKRRIAEAELYFSHKIRV